jgi:NAD-dependent DNA ligase
VNKIYLDENDQPAQHINFTENEIKAINTLYGIVMGITADQVVTDSEIQFLDVWLKNNDKFTHAFPLNVVKQRVNAILEDGIITPEERDDFYKVLISLQNNDFHETGSAGGFTNAHIFEDIASLTLNDAIFCLTGQFLSGPRDRCEQSIRKGGGITAKNITQNLNYLVVGTLASRDWFATGHGRKIEKALHYKKNGFPIAIISEENLLKFIEL